MFLESSADIDALVQLLSVSCLTVAALAGTMILHLMSGLNPRLNLALNGSLLVIWTLGFSLLAWWSSGTLGHVCNKANWQDETGIMVCRIYKALFAFSLLGLYVLHRLRLSGT